jgi:hypothetical protein
VRRLHVGFWALFGHGPMSDLSPLCARKRTWTKHPDGGADERATLKIYVPSATAN